MYWSNCPFCGESLQLEVLFTRDNWENAIYLCNRHGVIFERIEEGEENFCIESFAELCDIT